MNADLFRTPKLLPFFQYDYGTINHPDDDKESITSHIRKQPVIDKIPDDLWRTHADPFFNEALSQPNGRLISAMKIMTTIAKYSRRGIGNILIVPTAEEASAYDDIKRWDAQIVIDDSLAPNEIRSTYWRLHKNPAGVPVFVDGGLQITEDGQISVIQNEKYPYYDYHGYFARAFLA
jgi:hypothetical protein